MTFDEEKSHFICQKKNLFFSFFFIDVRNEMKLLYLHNSNGGGGSNILLWIVKEKNSILSKDI